MTNLDYLAIAWFALSWTLFSLASNNHLPIRRVSLTTAMNQHRKRWMQVAARRDLRMIDTAIMAGLQNGTAFFASTTIFAIGGCFALLGATDRVLAVADDLPIPLVADPAAFELKVFGLIGIFAYAFFKFGWSYRLFNYCSILIGAVPTMRDEAEQSVETERAVRRAAEMNILAGKHFNAGLRAIFFSIGYLGWFVGPPAFALSTLVLFAVLIRRQFFSAARRAVLSDGAGTLVLEELEHAKARGATIYAELIGFGMSGDAFHMTSPPEDGAGAARCMANALRDAGLEGSQVQYINAHGTSTSAGDKAEVAAIKSVFREHAYKLAVSSTKSMTGHLLGAAGAVEAIFSVLALREQVAPPTINLDQPDEGCDLDFVPHQAKAMDIDVVLSNSFGFGGTNGSLVFRRFAG